MWCCRRMTRAVVSNRWWHSRCGCGKPAPRRGCARRRTARSGWPRSAWRWLPVGEPVRPLVHGGRPPSVASVPRRAAELIAAQFDRLATAAEGCDALVASGLMPAVAGARSVAENLGIRSVFVSWCPIFLPSPHHRPHPLPGRPFPPDVTDNRCASGGRTPDRGPAVLGRPSSRARHRHGTRRSHPDRRAPVVRVPNGPDSRDPRASDRRRRHDPHRRRKGGRHDAARRPRLIRPPASA